MLAFAYPLLASGSCFMLPLPITLSSGELPLSGSRLLGPSRAS